MHMGTHDLGNAIAGSARDVLWWSWRNGSASPVQEAEERGFRRRLIENGRSEFGRESPEAAPMLARGSNMHKIIAVLFAAALLAGSASASDTIPAPDKIAVMRPIRQFVDSFNGGDLKTVCAAQSAIIDEFPPYLWQGATACADWSNDFDAYREKNGITDPKITLGLGQHVDVTGDRAYVVVPAHLTFKQNGKRVTERDPILTVTLQKIADSWRIAGWAWAKR